MQKNTGSYLKNQLHNQSQRIYLRSFWWLFQSNKQSEWPFFQTDDDIVYFNQHFLNLKWKLFLMN